MEQEQRIIKITRCMNNLEQTRNNQQPKNNYEDNYNWLWGEMDWLEELHRLIHEE